MANDWHVKWIREGVSFWNRRRKRVAFKPDLTGLRFYDLLPPDFRDDPKTSRIFERINLRDANLCNADLSRLNFRGGVFAGANLTEGNLSKSNFEKANFLGANLSDASFAGSMLSGAIFEEANLKGVSFIGSEMKSTFFIASNLTDTQIAQSGVNQNQVFETKEEFRNFTSQAPYDNATAEQPKIDDGKTHKNAYEVFFGTTRSPIYQRGALVGYGEEQWEQTNYGIAEVIVPERHRLGGIGKRLWRQLFNKKADELRLEHLISLNSELFFGELRRVHDRSGTFQRPTVFIHGYNTSFIDAVLSAAQFGHDLGIGQGIGLFSWPSKGNEFSYVADGSSAELNKYALAEFLEQFINAFPEHGVSLVAHSMGCRCLLGAVEKLAGTKPELAKSIHQIVLAAADVDTRLMPIVGRYAVENADRTTSYVGNKDYALKISTIVNQIPRVGFVPPAFVMDGLDTVLVNDNDLGEWSHGYIGRSRSVLADVHAILTKNSPPQERFSIRTHEVSGTRIWKLAD
jgi:esterase/lipase superfamily enzyme